MNLVVFSKFCEATKVSRVQAYRYFKKGRLTPHKIGTAMILIDLDEWNKNFPLRPVKNLIGIKATSVGPTKPVSTKVIKDNARRPYRND